MYYKHDSNVKVKSKSELKKEKLETFYDKELK